MGLSAQTDRIPYWTLGARQPGTSGIESLHCLFLISSLYVYKINISPIIVLWKVDLGSSAAHGCRQLLMREGR